MICWKAHLPSQLKLEAKKAYLKNYFAILACRIILRFYEIVLKEFMCDRPTLCLLKVLNMNILPQNCWNSNPDWLEWFLVINCIKTNILYIFLIKISKKKLSFLAIGAFVIMLKSWWAETIWATYHISAFRRWGIDFD